MTQHVNQPIGQFLLERGDITEAQLDAALTRQQAEGGYVGSHLLIAGALSRRALYQALADQWQLPLVDLVVTPPDPRVIRRISFGDAQDGHWLPYADDGRSVKVATDGRPTAEVEAHVATRFPDREVEWHCTTPWDLSQATQQVFRTELLYTAKDALAEANPRGSARPGLTAWQLAVPAVLIALLVLVAISDVRRAAVWLLTAANVCFLVNILFKVAASARRPFAVSARERRDLSLMRERERRGLPPVWRPRVDDHELPMYTVLVPVFHEANIIDKLIRNLGAIDYPKSRLEILVLMEAVDTATVEAAKRMRPPEYVKLVVVPEGVPQTKPRACNYGLAIARGDYVVIYDAEDRPDPDQLRTALAAFQQDRFEREVLGLDQKPLAVVQAALTYFNADYNVLTRMFAVEYAHWFESMLPGLEGTGIPLPLGGTSNHFDAAVLRELGAWDPYNVTEDADLGLRASVEGYRVSVIGSSTGEEACAETSAWIKQRTRWIKGYMITAAVNLRHPIRFVRRVGFPGLVGLVGLILGTPLAFLLYPLVVAFTLATYVGTRSFGLELPHWVVVSSVFTMVAGNGLMLIASALAAERRYNWRIGLFAIFLPAYWLLHAVAAWRALFQSIFTPHQWEKTPHGISEDYETDFAGVA
jgi:glycosyltransferase XagB